MTALNVAVFFHIIFKHVKCTWLKIALVFTWRVHLGKQIFCTIICSDWTNDRARDVHSDTILRLGVKYLNQPITLKSAWKHK